MLAKCGADRSRETTVVLPIDGATKRGWSKMWKRWRSPRQHTTGKVGTSGSGCFFDKVLLDETCEVYFGLLMCHNISVAVVTGSHVAARYRETREDAVSANSRQVEFSIRHRLFAKRVSISTFAH